MRIADIVDQQDVSNEYEVDDEAENIGRVWQGGSYGPDDDLFCFAIQSLNQLG